MINGQLIERIKYALSGLADIGEKQVMIYVEKDPKKDLVSAVFNDKKYLLKDGFYVPEDVVVSRLLVEPANFTYTFLKNFWKFYATVVHSIDNPVVLFSLRALVELAYSKILYFMNEPEESQRQLAVKYWLCSEGMISDKSRNVIYNSLLACLSDVKEMESFKKIMEDGFPLKRLSRKMMDAFPSPSSDKVMDSIEEEFVSLTGVKLTKKYMESIYSWFSQYVHGNILLLINLEGELTDKSHIFRSYMVLSSVGLHLLNSVNAKFGLDLSISKDIKAELLDIAKELMKNAEIKFG